MEKVVTKWSDSVNGQCVNMKYPTNITTGTSPPKTDAKDTHSATSCLSLSSSNKHLICSLAQLNQEQVDHAQVIHPWNRLYISDTGHISYVRFAGPLLGPLMSLSKTNMSNEANNWIATYHLISLRDLFFPLTLAKTTGPCSETRLLQGYKWGEDLVFCLN